MLPLRQPTTLTDCGLPNELRTMRCIPIFDKSRDQPQSTLHDRAMRCPPRPQLVKHMIAMLRPDLRMRTDT